MRTRIGYARPSTLVGALPVSFDGERLLSLNATAANGRQLSLWEGKPFYGALSAPGVSHKPPAAGGVEAAKSTGASHSGSN